MFVACKIPMGLAITHNNCEIVLNGPHTGLDPALLPPNGSAPDGVDRFHGWGLTEVQGPAADALIDWMDISAKGPGPVQAGAIIMADKIGDIRKEAVDNDTMKAGFEGVDPAKDLPKGVETASDKPKKG